jgi:hypothetical protein
MSTLHPVDDAGKGAGATVHRDPSADKSGRPTEGWVKVPESFLDGRVVPLTPSEKIVLLNIEVRARDSCYAFPGTKDLARRSRRSLSTTRRILDQLEAKGYIRAVMSRSGHYRLCFLLLQRANSDRPVFVPGQDDLASIIEAVCRKRGIPKPLHGFKIGTGEMLNLNTGEMLNLNTGEMLNLNTGEMLNLNTESEAFPPPPGEGGNQKHDDDRDSPEGSSSSFYPPPPGEDQENPEDPGGEEDRESDEEFELRMEVMEIGNHARDFNPDLTDGQLKPLVQVHGADRVFEVVIETCKRWDRKRAEDPRQEPYGYGYLKNTLARKLEEQGPYKPRPVIESSPSSISPSAPPEAPMPLPRPPLTPVESFLLQVRQQRFGLELNQDGHPILIDPPPAVPTGRPAFDEAARKARDRTRAELRRRLEELNPDAVAAQWEAGQ